MRFNREKKSASHCQSKPLNGITLNRIRVQKLSIKFVLGKFSSCTTFCSRKKKKITKLPFTRLLTSTKTMVLDLHQFVIILTCLQIDRFSFFFEFSLAIYITFVTEIKSAEFCRDWIRLKETPNFLCQKSFFPGWIKRILLSFSDFETDLKGNFDVRR